jgi:hypothetical protein
VQVLGRALLPGAAMLEAVAAAALMLRHGESQPGLLFHGATISEALVLHEPLDNAETVVICQSGAIQLSATGISGPRSHCAAFCATEPRAQPGSSRVRTRHTPLLPSLHGSEHLPAVVAAANEPVPNAGFIVHPAQLDSTLHLSGVWAERGSALEIPVAAGSMHIRQQSTIPATLSWHAMAFYEGSKGAAIGDKTMAYKLASGVQPPRVQLSHLHLKRVAHSTRAPAIVAQVPAAPGHAGDFVYQVDWQAGEPVHLPAGDPGSSSRSLGERAPWQIGSGGCTVRGAAVDGHAGVQGSVAAILQALQVALTTQRGISMAQRAEIFGVTPGPPVQPARASALAVVARVAAMEFPAADLSNVHIDQSQQTLVDAQREPHLEGSSVYGTAVGQGTVVHAKLLRSQLRVLPAAAQLSPMPRGSIASLKLLAATPCHPGHGEIRVSNVPERTELFVDCPSTRSDGHFILMLNRSTSELSG